jgi:glucuronate isomerase
MSHLLTSKLAETIYTSIEGLPIVDYHTHLPADEILNDHQFENIWELWLKHDHYKWRLMRGCGVEEKFITGDASPYEKFHAFASILPLAIGNPVHQWAHMELEKIFNITIPLNAETAEGIWNQTNSELSDNTTVSKLLQLFKVKLIATTDDPFDDLSSHKSIAAKNHPTQVLPTFRPDKHLFEDKIDLSSLKQRHDYFHAHGCQMSDHGLSQIPAPETPQYQALKSIAQWNHEKGWIMQLHLGPQREVNTRLSKQTGPDAGFDTIGSLPQTERLIHFLNDLDQSDQLPKTILYNLNPNESTSLCAALQNFQVARSRRANYKVAESSQDKRNYSTDQLGGTSIMCAASANNSTSSRLCPPLAPTSACSPTAAHSPATSAMITTDASFAPSSQKKRSPVKCPTIEPS